mmetsp:Transcript_35032/g.63020  ORF Transcript_35032/g.63020 Transcript_35032/m.63020 type:complete len:504 (-) Transcript_35032:1083-2594(-)
MKLKEPSKEDVVLLVGAPVVVPSKLKLLEKIKLFIQGALSLSIIGIFLILLCNRQTQHYKDEGSRKVSYKPHGMYRDKLAESVCQNYLEMNKAISRFSVVFAADPGDFSGVPEAFYILGNLKNQHMKEKFNSVCSDVVYGTLLNQPVLVVTTGIGPTTASLCAQEILTSCGSMIDEAFYVGTSGWSPQLGGVLNPPDCDSANSNGRISRIGDLCISPFSVNWQCKKSSWSQQSSGFPNQCFRPEEAYGPNATFLYGLCEFYEDNMDANLRLADQFLQAARSESTLLNMPPRPAAVVNMESNFWNLMSKGTNESYNLNGPIGNASTVIPHIWDYKECMEVDEQFFFTGVPWEIKSRDYVAGTLNAAFKDYETYKFRTARDVIAVSAMEGVGVGLAFTKYNRLDSTGRFVPYTHIRSMSNWVHHPVNKTDNGSTWATVDDFLENYEDGYRYAIETASSAVLSYYQIRCFNDQKAQAQDIVECKFSFGKKGGLEMPKLREGFLKRY